MPSREAKPNWKILALRVLLRYHGKIHDKMILKMRRFFELTRAKTFSHGTTHISKEVRELLWLGEVGTLIYLVSDGEVLITTHERFALESSADPGLFIADPFGHPALDIARLTGLLGIQRPQLARVLGLPWGTLEADPFGPVTQAGLRQLHGLLQPLREHKPTWRHIRWWLHQPLAELGDVLELDEMWTFVQDRDDKRWLGYWLRRYGANHFALWTALCRRTHQIVAWVSGNHSARTCRRLWTFIPEAYKRCHSFSDLWEVYAKVFPKATHRSVGKGSGQICHMERWNYTLHQRLARFTRLTLSFSKSGTMHQAVTQCFVHDYNLSCITYQ